MLLDLLNVSNLEPTCFVDLAPNVSQTATVFKPRARRVGVCLFDGEGEIGFRDKAVTLTSVRTNGNDAVPNVLGQEVIIDATAVNGGELTVSLISDGAVVALVRAIA